MIQLPKPKLPALVAECETTVVKPLSGPVAGIQAQAKAALAKVKALKSSVPGKLPEAPSVAAPPSVQAPQVQPPPPQPPQPPQPQMVPGKIFRSGDGRMRRDSGHVTVITDPHAQEVISIDHAKQEFRRIPMSALNPPKPPSPPGGMDAPQPPKMHVEDLGKMMIGGVEAVGKRITVHPPDIPKLPAKPPLTLPKLPQIPKLSGLKAPEIPKIAKPKIPTLADLKLPQLPKPAVAPIKIPSMDSGSPAVPSAPAPSVAAPSVAQIGKPPQLAQLKLPDLPKPPRVPTAIPGWPEPGGTPAKPPAMQAPQPPKPPQVPQLPKPPAVPKMPKLDKPKLPDLKMPQLKLPALKMPDAKAPHVLELWTDEKTQLPVLTKTAGPQGAQVEKVKSVQPGEPPASAFHIPAGYKQIETPKFGDFKNPGLLKNVSALKKPQIPKIPKLKIPKVDLSKLKLPQLPKPPIPT